MITFPDEFRLQVPYLNGFEDAVDVAANRFVEERNALLERVEAGDLYIKFIAGDRKGSIARLIPDTIKNRPSKIITRMSTFSDGRNYRIEDDRIYCVAKWDKRSNKVRLNLPNRDVIFLPNYEGPTVWCLFDKKAAKVEALANNPQKDIDGEILNVGDQVLYINTRYGQGSSLCHGVIREFTAIVDSRSTEIFTHIENLDVQNGEMSKVSYPHMMIWKKQNGA